MIISDPILHLGRLLRWAGRLPGDVLEDLAGLEEDVRKLGVGPVTQRRAFRIIQRVEGVMRGVDGVVPSSLPGSARPGPPSRPRAAP